jgi:hypothetical protein
MPNILDEIILRPAPNDIAIWWKKTDPKEKCDLLLEEETDYLDVFTSAELDHDFRIPQGISKSDNLSTHEIEVALRLFGSSELAKQQFCNYENRRRIVANYVLHHPAMLAYQVHYYRTARDVIPITFFAERIYELITGNEAFLENEASRVRAFVDIVLAVVAARVLRYIKPLPPAKTPVRALTDPIYDLPPEGGGMNINGRWYTEHALERMAPDTQQIRDELKTRAIKRLAKVGIKQGHPAYGKCLETALKKIHPRGIPPSVVEAEIMKPNSTSITVIMPPLKRGQVIVTVYPKKKK